MTHSSQSSFLSPLGFDWDKIGRKDCKKVPENKSGC